MVESGASSRLREKGKDLLSQNERGTFTRAKSGKFKKQSPIDMLNLLVHIVEDEKAMDLDGRS